MTSIDPVIGMENQRKRVRPIHLPAVDSTCYVQAYVLELGKYEDCLPELVKEENWRDLRRMLEPVADLVVKDALGQYFVDSVRHEFDSVMISGGRGSNAQFPFITNVMCRSGSDDVQVLKMLLAVGLDPDLPMIPHQQRPSHTCGVVARADLAGLIFPCRPCMTAAANGFTPLQAATENPKFPDDKIYPHRRYLRKIVKNYIESGGFETRFPSLAELAVQGLWFAVNNLLRRRVVAEAEFTETVEGKTAAEWAEFFKKPGIAEEIRYYATAPSVLLDETAKQMAAMAEKLCDTEDEKSVLSSKVIKLEKQVKELKDEVVANKAKNDELSEVMSVYRTRLEEAGLGCELKKENSPKSDSEDVESSVDSGCELGVVGASSSSDL